MLDGSSNSGENMNKVIASSALGVLTLVVLTKAYNFEDPVFNQILANDFDKLIEEPISHLRQRRDEEAVVDKCRRRMKPLCCAENAFEEKQDKHKEIKRQCFKEVTGKDKDFRDARGEHDPFSCDRVEKHRKLMTCVMQCVGQKKDMLDENGDPKDEQFVASVKDLMLQEPWFESLQEKVTSMCLDEARNATTNRDSTDTAASASDSESCNPAGIKLLHCLFREIQLGCPADQIKDQKACARARDKIRKHNDFFPPPPPAFMNDE